VTAIMKYGHSRCGLQKGYTITELVIVVAIAATLLMIALPNFVNWRRSIEYRAVAREVANALRFAQSESVMNNRQYRVQFETGRFRVQEADRLAAGGWISAREWYAVPTGITLLPANLTVNSSVDFNPNGTSSSLAANESMIDIIATNATPSLRYRVQVAATGRVVVKKP
jgi:prepilin-type N-terminal cleavage/methylation domain-containing protein